MAYRYCEGCDAGMDSPTFSEIMHDKHYCHMCNEEHSVLDPDAKAEALIELEARISAIEEQLRNQKD